MNPPLDDFFRRLYRRRAAQATLGGALVGALAGAAAALALLALSRAVPLGFEARGWALGLLLAGLGAGAAHGRRRRPGVLAACVALEARLGIRQVLSSAWAASRREIRAPDGTGAAAAATTPTASAVPSPPHLGGGCAHPRVGVGGTEVPGAPHSFAAALIEQAAALAAGIDLRGVLPWQIDRRLMWTAPLLAFTVLLAVLPPARAAAERRREALTALAARAAHHDEAPVETVELRRRWNEWREFLRALPALEPERALAEAHRQARAAAAETRAGRAWDRQRDALHRAGRGALADALTTGDEAAARAAARALAADLARGAPPPALDLDARAAHPTLERFAQAAAAAGDGAGLEEAAARAAVALGAQAPAPALERLETAWRALAAELATEFRLPRPVRDADPPALVAPLTPDAAKRSAPDGGPSAGTGAGAAGRWDDPAPAAPVRIVAPKLAGEAADEPVPARYRAFLARYLPRGTE